MADYSGDTGMVVAAATRWRGGRLVGSGRLAGKHRAVRSDRLELCLLLVTHLSIEVVQGCAHRLARLGLGPEPVGDRLEPRRRRNGFSGRAGGFEQVCRLCTGVLEGLQACTLRLGRMKPRLDLGSRPLAHARLRGDAALGERTVSVSRVSRGFTPTLILCERVKLGSLF